MAAIAGGVTSFMDMPNVNPPTLTRELLSQKYEIAAGKAHANFAFYMGSSNQNIDEIKSLQPGEACGVKIFMGASTGIFWLMMKMHWKRFLRNHRSRLLHIAKIPQSLSRT